MRKIKAVFFDLDGTLLETHKDLASAVNFALAERGYPKRSVSEIKSYLGNGMLALIKRAVPEILPDEEYLKIKEIFLSHYKKHSCDETRPYDGIVPLLKELAEKNIKLAVVSNKDEDCAVPIIKNYFGSLFDVVKGVKTDSDKKPSPKTALEALEALGVQNGEVLFVGDGMTDIKTAKNACVECIAVSYGYADASALEAEYGKKPVPDVETLRNIILSRI